MWQSEVFCNYLVHCLIIFLVVLFFPVEWTKAAIVALHKKGSLEDANNYRGISLLNALGKIFSYVFNMLLKTWSDVNMLIAEV